MLFDLKLLIILKIYIWKIYLANKAKRRLCCRYFPIYEVRAFTLAEILITLLIIGIVSSIVIPTLINDTQDAELKTALKKTYAELSVATKQIIFDNGGTFVGILANDSDYTGLKNAYTEHLNYTKSCNNARTQGCWHPTISNGGTWRTLSGGSTDSYTSQAGLVLTNGTLLNLVAQKADCSYSTFYTKPAVCAWIIADINGFKKPNVIGKDVFYFNILANKLEPFGAPDSEGHDCDWNGLFCAVPKLMQ